MEKRGTSRAITCKCLKARGRNCLGGLRGRKAFANLAVGRTRASGERGGGEQIHVELAVEEWRDQT
eukprot:6187382-Pleurochrysis_carterae.AAC.1